MKQSHSPSKCQSANVFVVVVLHQSCEFRHIFQRCFESESCKKTLFENNENRIESVALGRKNKLFVKFVLKPTKRNLYMLKESYFRVSGIGDFDGKTLRYIIQLSGSVEFIYSFTTAMKAITRL